jgi:hypothetical protein
MLDGRRALAAAVTSSGSRQKKRVRSAFEKAPPARVRVAAQRIGEVEAPEPARARG